MPTAAGAAPASWPGSRSPSTRWGQGLGAALTAAMTRVLLEEAEEVTLGVLTDNPRAIRLYERLGFTGSIPRTSVALASRRPGLRHAGLLLRCATTGTGATRRAASQAGR